jgi:hypothetical protein
MGCEYANAAPGWRVELDGGGFLPVAGLARSLLL